MMRRQVLAMGAVGILAAGSPLFAHHAWPVDRSRVTTVKGTVTRYAWANPHVMIGLDVKEENGTLAKWDVGGPSTARMAGNGWGRNTLKIGDVITAVGYQFADGSKILRLERIVMANGQVLLLYGRQ